MKLIFIVPILFLVGCTAKPIKTNQTENKEITIDFLFEHEGIKMYRFSDGGYYRYFTNKGACQWSETHGKHSIHKKFNRKRVKA